MELPRRGQNNGPEEIMHRSGYGKESDEVFIIEEMYLRPRLFMQDIWTFAYGLGFTYYVINYVSNCKNLIALQAFIYGLFLLVFHEWAVDSMYTFYAPNNLIYGIVACVIMIGTVFLGLEHGYRQIVLPIATQNWFEIVYGILQPIFIMFVLLDVRKQRKYNVGGILEICEFGFPFAFICALSLCVLCQIYNPDYELWAHEDKANVAMALVLSPLLIFFIILLVMEAVIHVHVVDTLISFSFAGTTMLLLEQGPDAQGSVIASFALTSCACIMRFCVYSNFIRGLQEQYNVMPMNNVVMTPKATEKEKKNDDLQDLEDVEVKDDDVYE
jgi:hypothetical protein